MRKAASYLVGEHDFKSFCTTRGQAEDTVRTIYRADVVKEHDMITITIKGSGFLYNMVRIMVGTVLDIGLYRKKVDVIPQVLATQNRHLAGRTAPASGLYLKNVFYR